MGRALLAAAVVLASLPAAACTTHQCDPLTVHYSGGEMVDDDTYETSPLDSPTEPWIDFRGATTIVVSFPESASKVIAGRPIVWIDTYVGVAPTEGPHAAQPNQGGDNSGNSWTVATGQLSEIVDAGTSDGAPGSGTGGFMVTNSSCAEYFGRFVVHFQPVGGAVGSEDGGAPSSEAGE